MGERAVGLRHLVDVVAFLDRIALAVGGVFDLGGERLLQRHALALGGVGDHPAHGQARAGAPAGLPSAPGRWRHRRGGT